MSETPIFSPLSAEEMVEQIAIALRNGSSSLTREADLYLASLGAAFIADRLAIAGLVVMRPAATPEKERWLV